MLPIAPFTETGGTFVNMEGRVQTFNAVVKPQGAARPGWKVLRMLGAPPAKVARTRRSSGPERDATPLACPSRPVRARGSPTSPSAAGRPPPGVARISSGVSSRAVRWNSRFTTRVA